MRQNFDPKIWGPKAWFFLESIAMAYPTEPTYDQKKAAENFFSALSFMLPCEKCRDNFKSHIVKYPLNDTVLSSRDNLYKWIVDIHNSVDPKKKRTYDETFKYYMEAYGFKITTHSKENDKRKKIMILVILLILVIFITYEIIKILI